MSRLSIALSIVVLWCATAFAQAADNFGFVSPNTREDLKLEEAIRGMSSDEETQLAHKARNLRCVAKQPVLTTRAVGSWSDGAEHSLLIRVRADESTLRYLMSRLGRTANQKAVIYFHPRRNGQATAYIIHPTKRFRNLAKISQLLDATGVAFRTLVPTKTETTVYVIDLDNSLSSKVRTATKRLRGRFKALVGTASFIGDDSVREKGQAIFQQEITAYESKHPNLSPACKSN